LDELNRTHQGEFEINISDNVNKLKEWFNTTVTVIWIPSHVGIKGNHKADTLAKEAAAEEDGEETMYKFRWNDVKIYIDNHINNMWQKMYRINKKGQHYKLLEPSVNRCVKYTTTNRNNEIIITRLRLGKCRLNSYLHEMKLHPTGKCEHCDISETIQHYLMDCPTANIFLNSGITIQQALGDETNQAKIILRTNQLKRHP